MRKKWNIRKLSVRAKQLGDKYNLDPVAVQLLINREIDESEFLPFLNGTGYSAHSPDTLPDIGKASKRIAAAIKKKEKIILFGDYDVDGLTSLAVFYDYIKDTAADFSFYVPHRIKEGFGLNRDALKKAKEAGASLIISFDCGTNSYEEIEHASSLGIDTIVVDHHQPKTGRTPSYAFINPKRKDSKYPFEYLSSAGVTFKLVQALKGGDCSHLLDLVALSIVCDVVPLRGENRYLLKEGIKLLRTTQRPSISALCGIAGLKQDNIDVFHIGYILGPRINASGRVNTAYDALNMFLSEDNSSALKYAKMLDGHNRLRRSIESSVLKEAQDYVSADIEDNPVLVVYNEGWHYGILGIVASRLVDKYYRPAFVIGFNNGIGKGSARSIEGFNLMNALGHCEDYLSSYGGHKKAAGIEILYKDVEDFRKIINEVARNTLKPTDLLPSIDIDLEIMFSQINGNLVSNIYSLKPFGEGNPQPLFITRNVSIKQPPKKVTNGMHSVWIENSGLTYEGVFFSRNDFSDIFNNGKSFDIVYSLEKNTYHNSIRLNIKDVHLG